MEQKGTVGEGWKWDSVPAGCGVLAIRRRSDGKSYYLAVTDLRQRAYDAHRLLTAGTHHNPRIAGRVVGVNGLGDRRRGASPPPRVPPRVQAGAYRAVGRELLQQEEQHRFGQGEVVLKGEEKATSSTRAMRPEGGNAMQDDRQTKADEMVHLYEALAAAVGDEIADRLFPGAWRHLRRIRTREREKEREHLYVEHKAHSAMG